MLGLGCALLSPLLLAAQCTPAAVTDGACNTDGDCSDGQICVNGSCAGGDGIPCNDDDACPAGHICGAAGLCEEGEHEVVTCRVTSDCPLDQYCNTSFENGMCMPLQQGSCRDSTQCPGSQICSAFPGGVGQCVECTRNSECASGECRPDGTCVPGAYDAGGGLDRALARTDGALTQPDTSVSGDDPSCGGDSQVCCGAGSSQASPCDHSGLSCLHDPTLAAVDYCWPRCNAVPCQTVEGSMGTCHISSNWQGNCQPTSYQNPCTYDSDCQQIHPSASCVYFDAYSAYCLMLGCDWQADCRPNYYCSTGDGNLCVDTSLFMP